MSTNNTAEGDTALAANELCRKCLLCCNGTLFSFVSVNEREIKKFREAGMHINERTSGKFSFDQPCSRLSGNSCSEYTSRPEKCRSFFCILQRKVMNGSISLEDSQKTVSLVKMKVVWLSQRVKNISENATIDMKFRDFLYSYHKKATDINNRGELSPSDREYIRGAFEYAKLVDRYFFKTSLLTKFAALIQSFQAESPKPQRRRLRATFVPRV